VNRYARISVCHHVALLSSESEKKPQRGMLSISFGNRGKNQAHDKTKDEPQKNAERSRAMLTKVNSRALSLSAG